MAQTVTSVGCRSEVAGAMGEGDGRCHWARMDLCWKLEAGRGADGSRSGDFIYMAMQKGDIGSWE